MSPASEIYVHRIEGLVLWSDQVSCLYRNEHVYRIYGLMFRVIGKPSKLK